MLIKVFRNALIAGIIMVLLVPGISCSKKIDITRVTLPFIGGPAIELKVRDFDAKGQSVNIIKDIPVSHAALILIDVWAGKPHTEDNINTKILPLINAARKSQILIVHSLNSGQINEKIEVLPGDIVLAEGDTEERSEFLELLQQESIKYLLYAGYNSNQCVLNRLTGIPEMSHYGYKGNIIFVRDASISSSHIVGIDSEVVHEVISGLVELNWGMTTTVDDLVAACQSLAN